MGERPNKSVSSSLFHIAWISVLIGVVMQLLTLVFVHVDTVAPVVRDMSQKVSWSVLVCMALAVATSTKPLPQHSAKGSIIAALTGLLAAPMAFVIARAVQKSVAGAIGVGGGANAPVSLIVAVSCLKGLEYAVLGFVIARITPHGELKSFVLRGFLAAVVFGPLIVLAQRHFAPATPVGNLYATGVNEIVFPVLCSGAIWLVQRLGTNAGAGASGNP